MISQILQKIAPEAGMHLSEYMLQAFDLYAVELEKWNKKVNLTAIRREKEIAIKHFIDALMLSRNIQEISQMLDIGSGAGIPAIPIKIISPDISIVSVDAVRKKILFQRHVARLLDFQTFEARHSRIEDLHAEYAGRFDVITSRAFTRLDRFVALGGAMLSSGGRMIAMKGPAVESEMCEGEEVIRKMGFIITDILRYYLPEGMGERCLITLTRSEAWNNKPSGGMF